MDALPLVEILNLHKSFQLDGGSKTIKQLITVGRIDAKGSSQDVLNGIDLEVYRGEFLGILGRNGSGKSTLLKIIAGVYSPTDGSVAVRGRLVPFIELGVGFNPELSGKDNVYLSGALLGFSRNEVSRMYPDVVKFAELEGHMETKLKNFSSGMQVRLAFSIAIRAKADILLIDEVLAVGDSLFQKKCFDYFESLKKEGQTVVFVSHDLESIKKFCSRVLLIEKGQIVSQGNPESVVSYYESHVLRIVKPKSMSAPKDKPPKPKFVISCPKALQYAEPLDISITWKIKGVGGVGFAIYSLAGGLVYATNSMLLGLDYFSKDSASMRLVANLEPGSYSVTVGLFGRNDSEVLSMVEGAATFDVISNNKSSLRNWRGNINLNSEWS